MAQKLWHDIDYFNQYKNSIYIHSGTYVKWLQWRTNWTIWNILMFVCFNNKRLLLSNASFTNINVLDVCKVWV